MIDPSQLTLQELKDLDYSKLTEEERKEFQNFATNCYSFEQAIKLIINSAYGAFGSVFFHWFNIDIAETITLQGQDAIKHTVAMTEKYFKEFFHRDKQLHKKLGLDENLVVNKCKNPVATYCDTDSVASNSIIRTKDIGDLTIEKLFDRFAKCGYEVDIRGNEVIRLDEGELRILNYNKNDVSFNDVKILLRHKVNKPKWFIQSQSGLSVEVTDDHSIMVLRDDTLTKIKASSINAKIDKLIVSCDKTPIYSEIVIVEQRGHFEDEYVYDVEMYDETHTFFANDILVHNSSYLSFGEPLKNSQFSGTEKEFILLVNEHRLSSYFNNIFDEYAKKFNTKSYLNFELETIAKNAVFVAKKKYVQDIVWKDGKEFDSLSYIKTTGLELVQASTPPFCREKLKELITLVFSKGKLKPEDSVDIVKKIKEVKDLFKLANPERISLSFSISDYNKFILNDTTALEVASGCPMHVRAAGYHNYLINKNGLKSKYELIKSGDKIKFHNTKDKVCDVFGFKTGAYPIEVAPQIDYDTLFSKTIIDPINRIISATGISPINYNLSYYKNSLF